jgi:hypothetical protein
MAEILTILSLPNQSQDNRNLLITNRLHQLDCSGIAGACTSVVRLFRDGARLTNAIGDRLEAPFPSTSGEVLLILFRAAKSSIRRSVLHCNSALHCRLVCDRPGPCYRWPVFAGNDLALQSGSC